MEVFRRACVKLILLVYGHSICHILISIWSERVCDFRILEESFVKLYKLISQSTVIITQLETETVTVTKKLD